MKQISILALGLAVAGSLATFGDNAPKQNEIKKPQANVRAHKAYGIDLDPELQESQKETISKDLARLLQWDFQGISKNAWYAKLFGGTSSASAAHYLDQRVNYLIPEKADLDARISFPSGAASLMNRPSALNDDDDDDDGLITMATNIGTLLWLFREADSFVKGTESTMSFRVGTKVVPLASSWNGIVRLGKGFSITNFKNSEGKTYSFTSAVRMETLVHEARHSDCVGGLEQSDVFRVATGKMPLNSACGNLHGECPKGHSLEGIVACDGHPWGAYAVGGMFAVAQAQSCKNCTELELQQAKISAIDSLGRVSDLKKLLAGEFGMPDMQNRPFVVEKSGGKAAPLVGPSLHAPVTLTNAH